MGLAVFFFMEMFLGVGLVVDTLGDGDSFRFVLPMNNIMIDKKYPPKALAACLGLAGLTGITQAQELFGAYSDYQQYSGSELLQDALLLSEDFGTLKAGVRGGVKYDNNIFLSDSGKESDVIFNTELILGLESKKGVQDRWALTYIGGYKFYADNSQFNGLDNNLFGSYSKTFSKTQVDLSASVTDISGSDRFVSAHTDKLLTAFNLDVSRVLTGKTRLDVDLGFRGLDYDNDDVYFDRNTYNTRVALQYQWTGKTTVGPYVGYEYVDLSGGSNEEALSAGVSFSYQVFAKTALTGSIGGESRSFSGNAISDRSSFVWDLGASHNYSAKTKIDAHLYGKAQPSVSRGGAAYESTGVSLDVNHATSSRLNLRARFGYEHDDYFIVNDNDPLVLGSDITDNDYYFVSVGGQYRAAYGVLVGADASWRTQNSDDGNDDFDGFTLQLSATYYF